MGEVINMLQESLNKVFSGLNLDARCVSAYQNRHTAIYDVVLSPGCKVRKIENSAPEIALALKSKTEPILKSIPEKGIVRLHVATRQADILKLSDIYDETERPDYFLPFLLGETDEGNKLWTDFAKNPHLLVAGSTGSGKSVFLHLLIENVYRLNKSDDYDINLWLSDPKMVEFNRYKDNETEYNITSSTDTYEGTILMLQELEEIMEDTYKRLYEMKLNSIEQCSKYFKKHVVIIDECADLIMYDKKTKRFETLVCKLAQRCRAAGISIVLATQRPSVDVLTGLIKANFPARLACKVSSKTDSRVILDRNGAESLLGCGDAILNNYNSNFTRFQIAMP